MLTKYKVDSGFQKTVRKVLNFCTAIIKHEIQRRIFEIIRTNLMLYGEHIDKSTLDTLTASYT